MILNSNFLKKQNFLKEMWVNREKGSGRAAWRVLRMHLQIGYIKGQVLHFSLSIFSLTLQSIDNYGPLSPKAGLPNLWT